MPSPQEGLADRIMWTGTAMPRQTSRGESQLGLKSFSQKQGDRNQALMKLGYRK